VDADAAEAEQSAGLRLLLVALAGAVLFHGGLLPFTHGNTYDAFIHMFLGDSYHRSWFDTWEPRWYTGFATTSYPPGSHMAIAALMHVLPLRAAFVAVQLGAILLLTVGVFRFAQLWVPPRPAGYAAIALVLSSSISETVHLFGQLPTTLSLGIFLNGLPYVYRWIVFGSLGSFAGAVIFTAATTAAHHVTTIFGGVLFILPLGLHALKAVADLRPRQGLRRRLTRFGPPLGRGVLLAVAMLGAIVVTVLPYWLWSSSDPITQVPIPHGSRESFLVRRDLGFIFFVLPWGLAILALPYVVYVSLTTRLWPLGMMVLLCTVLGTGGTTPIPRKLLGGAFDILTLDRFTFWATILILPFLGHLIDGLISGRSSRALRAAFGRGVQRLIVGGLFAGMTLVAVFAAILPTIQPTQPRFIDPTPIVRFLEEDEHDRWRYLTLGFGDQFAYLSAQTTALSVDGNYHSARRLPDMTRFSVERLENAKYLGVPGLGSLSQFLVNADRYNLKYVFANDEFYDPLLHFTGWTRLNRLANGVTVWEKPDVTPLPILLPRRTDAPVLVAMWGIVPPTALLLAAAVFLTSLARRNFGIGPGELRPLVRRADGFARPGVVRMVVLGLMLLAVGLAATVGTAAWRRAQVPLTEEEAIAAWFDDLDFRRFESSYDRLDPLTRPDFETVMFGWRWTGGLIASYGKLTDVRTERLGGTGELSDWRVELDWLTALDLRTEVKTLRLVRREGRWFVAPTDLRAVQSPALLQRQGEIAWNVTGRRQPRPETDLHRDRLDRPRIALTGTRLVERAGRFSLVGALTNTDADPATVSLFGDLVAEGQSMVRQAAGTVHAQRLLPAETAGFRIDFEGVLSLQDEAARGTFDPTLFIPLELPAAPEEARVEARALVTDRGLYRGITLNGLRMGLEDGHPVLRGTAVNAGTEVATVVRILVLLYDTEGLPVWTEAGYVETNIYPGQSAPFRVILPARGELRVLAPVDDAAAIVNGSNPQADSVPPDAATGTLPLPPPEGYGAIRLHVSTMTYDPLF
jgi:hypothetical protein